MYDILIYGIVCVLLLAVSNIIFFSTDEEIINQIKGTNQALAEIKELLKQQVKRKLKSIVCHQWHWQKLISGAGDWKYILSKLDYGAVKSISDALVHLGWIPDSSVWNDAILIFLIWQFHYKWLK